MRLLHLFSNYKWTGPAEPAVNLAATLARRGHQVRFLCSWRPEGLDHSVAAHARAAGLEPDTRFRLDKHFRPGANLLDMRRLPGLIREGDFHVVHAHQPNDHLLGGWAARRAGVPVVRTSYDGAGLPDRLRTRWCLAHYTDGLAAVSRAVVREAVERHGLPPGRVRHVEGAVDTARFDPARPVETPPRRPAFGLPGEAFVLGIVARMQTHRRYPVLLEALVEARRRHPELHLVVVGGGTRREEVAEAPARRLGLDGAVRFVGYQFGEDYVATLRALDAKVFLVPGSDGSCRAVREAMAAGLPVVASRRGILPELVEDGVTGRLVDDTVEGLAEAFVGLARDREAARRMGGAGLATARARFGLETQAEAVEALYREVLGG